MTARAAAAARLTKRGRWRAPKSMAMTSRVRDAGVASVVVSAVSLRANDASAPEADRGAVADLSLLVVGRRLQQLFPRAVQEGCRPGGGAPGGAQEWVRQRRDGEFNVRGKVGNSC